MSLKIQATLKNRVTPIKKLTTLTYDDALDRYYKELRFLSIKVKKIKNDFFYKKLLSQGSGKHYRTWIHGFLRVHAFKNLLGFNVRAVGRTKGGTISVYSKGCSKRLKQIKYAQTLQNLKYLGCALHYTRDFYTNRIAALCVSATSEVFYLPRTTTMRLLQIMVGCDFIMYYSIQDLQNVYIKYRYCEVLYALPQRTKICYFTDKLNSKIKCCKSAGCYATIVKHLSGEVVSSSAIVLPSKKSKIINSDIVVLVGRIVGSHKKYFQNTRAGFNRSHGFKQTVRGVVKNPVDHPHGGRTRTILWPRTPWGKTAK